MSPLLLCLFSLPGVILSIPGMVEEYLLSEGLIVEVGIDLRCSYVCMSEELLDDAEVGSAAEECCGEGVAEGVWRYRLHDSGHESLFLYHDEDHRAREVVPATVEEYIVLFAGFYLQQATVFEPRL